MQPAPQQTSRNPVEPLACKLGKVDISKIRRDGETQSRVRLSESVVNEYADLMRVGVKFPPVRIWFDGTDYWLSDGFQRVAAAELIGYAQIGAEIMSGTVSDARWDSYSANSKHGVRRSADDIRAVVARVFQHTNAARLSNNQIARHLGIPEATLRRWRKHVSSSTDEDTVRVAVRRGKTYPIETARIGRGDTSSTGRPRSMRELREDLWNTKIRASAPARRILNIFDKWVFGNTSGASFLQAIETVVEELICARPLESNSQKRK